MSPSESSLERWEELACDAALFGLDDAELAELKALDVEAARLDLELLAGEIAARTYESRRDQQPALPAALGEKLLAQLDAKLDTKPAPPMDSKVIPFPLPAARAPEARRRSPSFLPWLVAAAAIVIAVIGWFRRDPPVTLVPPVVPVPTTSVPRPEVARPETPATAREVLLALAGTAQTTWKATEDPSAKSASGDVVWHSGAQRGFMRFKGLAANDPSSSQYQLWIFDADRDERYPVDGGVFDVGPEGEVVVPIAAKLHVDKPKLFAVTVEKPGGVVVSKRERIVLTASLPPT